MARRKHWQNHGASTLLGRFLRMDALHSDALHLRYLLPKLAGKRKPCLWVGLLARMVLRRKDFHGPHLIFVLAFANPTLKLGTSAIRLS